MEDEKLVRRLQKGSRTALEQAINRYTAYVSTIVWRTLGAAATREDTEEVVSDVFLSLRSHAHELDPKQGLRPWLGAVARNRATDCLRRTNPAARRDRQVKQHQKGRDGGEFPPSLLHFSICGAGKRKR